MLSNCIPSVFQWVLALGIALSIAGQTEARDLITVGTGSGFDFSSVQAAVDAANSGDIVDVAAGVFTEGTKAYRGNGLLTGLNFENKDNIVLRGAGADQTVIDGTGVTYGLMFDSSDNITVSGIKFQNGTSNTVALFNNPSAIAVVYTILDARGGITTFYDGSTYDHVTFVGNGNDLFTGSTQITTVTNSIVFDIDNLSTGGVVVNTDRTDFFSVAHPNYASGTNITLLDPQFVDAASGDYHLSATSPLLTLADDGSHLGALGAATVPEPGSFAMFALACLLSSRRRRSGKNKRFRSLKGSTS